MLNVEDLRLPSLDANPDPVAANRPWTYPGAIGPSAMVRFLSVRILELLIKICYRAV